MSSPGLHVLVVEDDRVLRMVLAEVLRDEGYRVSLANDGLQALGAVEADAPDLILLDVGLPRMGGADFLASWESAVVRALPPIVVLSGTSRLPESFGAGAVVGHLIKPFDLDALLSTVASAVKPRRPDLHVVSSDESFPRVVTAGAS
ncbi:MAG: response regulator [Chloroflexi bacterium]|nr:response regulator [Chloroflexota bacterium]